MMKKIFELFSALKHKWGIKSNWDFFLINCVFALAGMAIVYVRKPVFHLFGLDASAPLWLKTIVYLAVVFPTYQANLLLFGFLLGQFTFFWNKEKQMWGFIRRKLGA